MSKTPKAAPATTKPDPTAVAIPDPKRTPVVFVNDVSGAGFLNGVINLTLATARFSPMSDGSDTLLDLEVSSRLRMDLHCAQVLRDTLTTIIDQNTKPATVRTN